MSATSFGRDISLRLASKCLAILALLLAGYLIQPSQENYRHRQAVRAEIEKTRLLVMAETWSHLYSTEATTKTIMVLAAESGTKRKSPDALSVVMPQIKEQRDILDRQSEAFHVFLRQNRFWYPTQLYRQLIRHNANHYRLIEFIMRDDLSAYINLVPELNESRQNIDTYLSTFR